MERAQGFAQQGDQKVETVGVDSSTLVQQNYPFATVTVYLTGTTTLATIFSDNQAPPTPLANPFTANNDGYWFFYAADGRYDVMLSGGVGNLAPWTIGDLLLGTGGGGGGQPGARGPCVVTDFVLPRTAVSIGDGNSHPLSQFYPTLVAAQADYPFAQSLSDELAWCAIQLAVYQCSYIFLPPGSYQVNRPIDVTNKQFGGLHFSGAGQQSQKPITYTDLNIVGTTGNQVTSAAQPFKPWNKWNVLTITGGTGFTTQRTLIVSVSSTGIATCQTVVGIPGSAGGQATTTTGVGSRIIANTGSMVFDCSGSGLLTFEDIFIDGGAGSSTIGFLFGRTYEQSFAESSLINLFRVLVVLQAFVHAGVNVNQCLNGGQYLGSIGVVNWCSENMTILHCYFEADRAYIGQNQLPLNICDDYPLTTGGDGLTHGQPLRYFLPKSAYATLYGGDTAVPVHISNVTVSGATVTYTTTENLNDPNLFVTRSNGVGWYNAGGVTVRGVTGFSYQVNCTTAIITLIDSHTFSITVTGTGTVTGSYTGGGTAFLLTWFSEGMDTVISSSFIGKGGPCVTLGGVGMFRGYNIYTLSYHPSLNPNIYAAYQIAGQCYTVQIEGASEACSRVVYSRYTVYDFRVDVDNPQDPDPGVSRMWLDGQVPDNEGATLVPGIVAGSVRLYPDIYGGAPHQLIESNAYTGVVSCKAVLAANQRIGLAGGAINVQVETSESWNPAPPGQIGAIYDFATHWGRRDIIGPLSLSGPIYSKSTELNINTIVGADTDVQVSSADATNPVTIHTFTDHGLYEGQAVTVSGLLGITLSAPITNLPCHIVSSNSITVPGISGTGAYIGGGIVRARGKQSILGLFDAGQLLWGVVKAGPGNLTLYDARVNRVAADFDRDVAVLGNTGITYNDLVIGSDSTTVTSAARPFIDPLSVGQTLQITGGTGFTIQTVTINSVSGNVAHCNVSLGIAGSTGGAAFNPFITQIVGDYITMPNQLAPSGTLNYLAINSSGTVLNRTIAQMKTDLGI